MRISDWSSDVCSSDLPARFVAGAGNLWRASTHKGSPMFRRRAPARNTLGPRGLLTARAAARRQEAPRDRGKAHRTREWRRARFVERSEEHTSELQSLMRISYAVFCLKKKRRNKNKSLQT